MTEVSKDYREAFWSTQPLKMNHGADPLGLGEKVCHH